MVGGVSLERRDRTAVILIDRPNRRNALDDAASEALLDALAAADDDPDTRAIVVAGAGSAFCAGRDLSNGRNSFTRRGAQPDSYREFGGRWALRVLQASKPVVACVNGAAVGLGASLTCAADVRIASDHAFFDFRYAARGMTPEGLTSWLLPRVVGLSRALDWTMSGRVVSAAEAERAGFVSRIVPASHALESATAAADQMGEMSTVALALTRRLLWRSGGGDPVVAHHDESRVVFRRARSHDAQEAVSAFHERRAPRFDEVATVADLDQWLADPHTENRSQAERASSNP